MIFLRYFVVKLEMLKVSERCYKQDDIINGVIEEKDDLEYELILLF